MEKKLLLKIVPLLLMLLTSMAWAQERVVKGKVTSSEDGTALPGVNVVVKGTTTGSVSDSEGNYSLSVPNNPKASLVYSFIGMQSQEVEIGDREIINVSLSLDVTQLSEVVVVGYGTQQKSKLSSSQSSVAGADISSLAAPSFDTQLSGRSAGVQVTVGTGIIGQTPTINIRGVNSLTSGTFPLVVVDGVPMVTGNQSAVIQTNPLADINPNDIETLDILKDGAATAIYGSRAANGVILITTKRGAKNQGKVSVDLSVTTGFSEAVKKFDVLNSEQFILIANEKLTNSGATPGAVANPTGESTDWQDLILRRGSFTNYNLGVSGSTKSTNYFFSLGYQKQQGAVVSNDFDRLSFRANLDHKFNKFLETGMSLAVNRSNTSGLNTGTNALSGNIAAGLRLFPNVSALDASNPTGYNLSPDGSVLGSGPNTRNIDNNYTNAKFVLDNNIFQAGTDRVLGNVYAKINIIEGLSLRTQYGIDYTGNLDFQSLDPRHGDGRGSNGFVFEQYRQVTRWNTQNTINFNREFGLHGIDIVAGAEFQKTTTKSFFGQGANTSDLFFQQNNLISGQFVTPSSGGFYAQNGFASYFGRLSYSFDERYLVGLSLRNDALSNLPEATRKGTFFGGSFGYRLSKEKFFQSLGIENILSDVKLRGSYAEVGNVDIGNFPYQAQFGAGRYGSQNGAGFTQAGNPLLKWETSKKLNFGTDLSFLNNKIQFVADYFINDVDGLILDAPTVGSVGIPNNSISKNVGSLSNSGLELSISTTPINSKGFRWDISANFTQITNQVKTLAKNTLGETLPLLGVSTYTITREGESANSIYGFVYAGVNPANGNPLYQKGNGSIVQRNGNTGTYSYYDPANGANESVTTLNGVNAALNTADVNAGGDRRILGQTLPKWFGGLTNTVSYKGLSLEVFIRFQGGNKIYNQTKQDNLLNQDFNNSGTALLNRWTPENTNTDVPKMWLNRNAQVNQSGQGISRFVESGDFLRIQNVILSYSVPKSILEKTGEFKLSSVKVFAQAQNVLTFTNYTGIDPELGSSGSQTAGTAVQGFDNNTSPIFRTFTFGINIGF